MSWWSFPASSPTKSPILYGSKADMLAHNAQYRRAVDTMITPGWHHLALVPGVTTTTATPPPKTDPVLSKLPYTGGATTQQLQNPVANPVQYFTDKLIRDPPPQPSWWSDLQHGALRNPGHLLETAFGAVVGGVKYIGWNYVDFFDQIRSWDGTWWGLVQHSALLWRTLVTVLLTAGLIQVGPLLLAVTEWARMLGSLLASTFGLAGDALGMVWEVVDDLAGYIGVMVQRILHTF